ncbi:MAG: 2-isopropylmalate synthase, partial [Methanomassiliicoccaceae archaeon]|nr:2-isopropylmalate synthase [Methanomassiliicoccaceae archaeon]
MIYDSQYNRLALLGKDVRGVSLFDTTLRDGEQAPGIALSMDDKLKIASALNELGVGIMEVGFAASGDTEKKIIKKIGSMGFSSTVCSLARSVKSDIDAVYESVKYAQNPMIHMVLGTSNIHVEQKFKKTNDQ